MKAYFYYWGPLLFKIKVEKKELTQIKKLYTRSKDNLIRFKLAGNIKHEYKVDHIQIQKILEPYLKVFKDTYYQWYNAPLLSIDATEAWVNYMKPGDFNPLHVHPRSDFSSVLYTDIPKKLSKEIKEYEGTGPGPGCVAFHYGEDNADMITIKTFVPEEGDMFIFPGKLKHIVSPFKSNCERVSIAINYNGGNK